ncbi:MAG: NAD(P)-dependent alcohol dehydrogenase [Oceanicoccus sp.]
MKTIQLSKPGGLDNFKVVDAKKPEPATGEILVELKASSLNYHDYIVAIGGIPTPDGRIPMSDGAGTVVGTGPGVKEFSVGDNVVSTFFPNWVSGEPAPIKSSVVPGDSSDGYAREYVCAAESAFTKAPAGYSHQEAATITCAGVTAWRGLIVKGQVKSGDCVLVQGTGGVSIYTLQLAKMAGATVIATSSSGEKMERLKEMGADHVINYKENPKWGKVVKDWTGGRGVDHVVEVGGPETLGQSIFACKMGGHIALVGVLTGVAGNVPTAALFSNQVTVSGISVGSRADQQDMVRALDASAMRPVIDRSFPMESIGDAFRHQESQKHFGKICLDIGN